MSAMATRITQSTSVADPKQTFESALAQVQESRGKDAARRIPIAARRHLPILVPNPEVAHKQALNDAARALARLWNISPTLVR